MPAWSELILGSFTTPMRIQTDVASMLWLLPLVAVIAVVYKATKVGSIRPRAFAKESALLFGSILVFIAVAGAILYALTWAAGSQLPTLLDGSSF